VHHQRLHARERASSKDESKQPETDFRIVQRRAHFLHAPDTAGDVSQSDDAFVNHDDGWAYLVSSGESGRREVWIQFHFVTDFRCQRVVIVIDTDTPETSDLGGARFEKFTS
jgi:hypothetical protein